MALWWPLRWSEEAQGGNQPPPTVPMPRDSHPIGVLSSGDGGAFSGKVS